MSIRAASLAPLLAAPSPALAVSVPEAAGTLGASASMLVTLGLVIVTVVVHYHGLNLIVRVCDRIPGERRLRIAEMVMAILMLHVAEIMLFAMGFRLLAWNDPVGALGGTVAGDWSDYFYFTATVYTTVGFGDLVPRSGLRLLTAFTSLTGLVMITWSASLTFLEMQRARALDARE